MTITANLTDWQLKTHVPIADIQKPLKVENQTNVNLIIEL